MNNNKEYENEKDIEILTLPTSKLQIFSPPSTIGLADQFVAPRTTDLNIKYASPERTNFTFCSKNEYLGVGGFSKVYKFRGDIENKAVKKIYADPKYYSKKLTAEDSIKREIFGMKKINCNNSLKIYEFYQNKEKDTYYLLMEQCDGNMEKYIKDRGYPLNIYEILNLLNQLNKAFYLLEINNIIHRDIKPSNILYKEDKKFDCYKKRINKKLFEGKKLTFKLGDYGICLPLYGKKFSKSQFMGTLDYMAPEIYEMKCEKEHPIYTKKIDLFSLGQTILFLMGYIKKASSLNLSMINELKKNCDLFNGKVKEKMLADLIFNYLLIVEPEKRADWVKYFEHPIFGDNNIFNQVRYENLKKIEKKYIKRNSMDNLEIKIPKNMTLYNHSKEKKSKSEIKYHINNNNNNTIINLCNNLLTNIHVIIRNKDDKIDTNKIISSNKKNKNNLIDTKNNKFKNSKNNNKYNGFTKVIKVISKKNKCKTPNENHRYKLRLYLSSYNKFSKSYEKYEKILKNNMVKNCVNGKKINTKSNRSKGLRNNNNLNGGKSTYLNKHNKFNNMFNNKSINKKRIDFFNIRVFNNKIEEDPNKIIKNNGFYFSKYSIYNHEY